MGGLTRVGHDQTPAVRGQRRVMMTVAAGVPGAPRSQVPACAAATSAMELDRPDDRSGGHRGSWAAAAVMSARAASPVTASAARPSA